jgi:hypothetical protein
MVEAMIDIETLDTENDAVVIQIGWVIFDGKEVLKRACLDLSAGEQLAAGRTVSASTLQFWMNPQISAVAHDSLAASEGKTNVEQCLVDLQAAISVAEPYQIWAKGSFDFNILENLYSWYGLKAPWKFYQCRDLRTFMKECGVPKHDNISHNALDDCLNQHIQLLQCREKISA